MEDVSRDILYLRTKTLELKVRISAVHMWGSCTEKQEYLCYTPTTVELSVKANKKGSAAFDVPVAALMEI
jgi:hypothetical protein